MVEGFSFIGAARDSGEALSLIERFAPQLVIMDISTPDCDGLELAARIREAAPRTIIVLLSGCSDFGYGQRAIELGVFRSLNMPIRSGNRDLVQSAIEQSFGSLRTAGNLDDHLAP